MTVDWINFTPWRSLMGGVLIGLSVALFLLLNGRIAGISGILGGFLNRPRGGSAWRVLFLIGLLASSSLYGVLIERPKIAVETSTVWLIIAGLLVGFGTQLGSGCTSGHGICGISRLSRRSLIATAVFMAAGMAGIYMTRHVIGM